MSDYHYFPRSILYPLESSEFIGFALPTGQMQKGRARVCSALSVARVGPRVALQRCPAIRTAGWIIPDSES
jgi:hypothetical protein